MVKRRWFATVAEAIALQAEILLSATEALPGIVVGAGCPMTGWQAGATIKLFKIQGGAEQSRVVTLVLETKVTGWYPSRGGAEQAKGQLGEQLSAFFPEEGAGEFELDVTLWTSNREE